MVADEAGLVGGDAVDRPAAVEQLGDGVRIGQALDDATGGCELVEGRFGREQGEGAGGQQDATLVGPVRVDVDDWCGLPGGGAVRRAAARSG